MRLLSAGRARDERSATAKAAPARILAESGILRLLVRAELFGLGRDRRVEALFPRVPVDLVVRRQDADVSGELGLRLAAVLLVPSPPTPAPVGRRPHLLLGGRRKLGLGFLRHGFGLRRGLRDRDGLLFSRRRPDDRHRVSGLLCRLERRPAAAVARGGVAGTLVVRRRVTRRGSRRSPYGERLVSRQPLD